jgi:1,5-anhydro-D-fructose reductase (1,5-anhydro-D-mannitol-forming)
MNSGATTGGLGKRKSVRLGIVGCAHCHTPWIAGVLKNRPEVQVAAVWDHDRARGAGVAQPLGARVVDAPQDIWADASIDGVFLLAETDRHEALVLEGAAAKKPMFVEKPLGVSARAAWRMADALTAAGVIFHTGYRTRSEAVFVFLREQIRQGILGRVTRIRYINGHGFLLQNAFGPEHQWMTDPAQAGGGAFLDLGTHAIDSVLWLMGEQVESATSITGRGTLNYGPACEEFGEGLMRFGSGAIGSVAAAWVDVDQPIRCTVSGTEGHAYVLNNQLFLKSRHIAGADGTQPWTALPAELPLAFDLFVNAVQGEPHSPLVTPQEAAQVCAVQEAMATGARTGTWVAPQKSGG